MVHCHPNARLTPRGRATGNPHAEHRLHNRSAPCSGSSTRTTSKRRATSSRRLTNWGLVRATRYRVTPARDKRSRAALGRLCPRGAARPDRGARRRRHLSGQSANRGRSRVTRTAVAPLVTGRSTSPWPREVGAYIPLRQPPLANADRRVGPRTGPITTGQSRPVWLSLRFAPGVLLLALQSTPPCGSAVELPCVSPRPPIGCRGPGG